MYLLICILMYNLHFYIISNYHGMYPLYMYIPILYLLCHSSDIYVRVQIQEKKPREKIGEKRSATQSSIVGTPVNLSFTQIGVLTLWRCTMRETTLQSCRNIYLSRQQSRTIWETLIPYHVSGGRDPNNPKMEQQKKGKPRWISAHRTYEEVR